MKDLDKDRPSPTRVLLLGYGGANNTGAEIRILTIIDDVRAAFGPEVVITVATVNGEKTRRVLGNDARCDIVQLPYVFPWAVWRLTARFDVVMLVEGSTFKDSWSSALLYLFLWGAFCARLHGRAAIAYAVDAGRMSALNRWLTRCVCNGMDLIITRTANARAELRRIGVAAEVEVTTDTAFQFETPVQRAVGDRPTVGCAPVEFHEWPVRMRPWGPRERCYHWPYYFSWDDERAARSAALVSSWRDLVVHIVESHGWQVRLIAMEELDQRICRKIVAALPATVRACVVEEYAGQATPQRITGMLRGLDYLATSRYHACVLSMAGHVPQFAVHHDERLQSLYGELDLQRFAIAHDTPELATAMRQTFEDLVYSADAHRVRLAERLEHDLLPRCRANRSLLRRWAARDARRDVEALA